MQPGVHAMATRNKPTPKAAPRSAAQTPAQAAAGIKVARGQGLLPPGMPAAATRLAAKGASPAARALVSPAPAKPPVRIKLAGVEIKKVLNNLAAVVGKVVLAAQPPVALPSRLLGTLQQPDTRPQDTAF